MSPSVASAEGVAGQFFTGELVHVFQFDTGRVNSALSKPVFAVWLSNKRSERANDRRNWQVESLFRHDQSPILSFWHRTLSSLCLFAPRAFSGSGFASGE